MAHEWKSVRSVPSQKGFHHSMMGPSDSSEVRFWCQKVISNKAFITKEDIKILKFLATKGDFPEMELVLKEKDGSYEKLKDILNSLPSKMKYEGLKIEVAK